MATRIAYVINRYPMVSHSFIRREILALERQDFEILRISINGWDATLVDETDQQERLKTRYILQNQTISLLLAVLRTLLMTPRRFFTAFALAVRMGRGAQRSVPYHLAYLAEACCILPWLKSFGATHMHAHFGTNSAEVVMLAHALGGPQYSFTVHGQDELLFGGTAEKVHRAAFVVAISSFGRSQLYRRVEHKHWSKIKVVHCGLETAFHGIDSVPPAAIPRLVCVGRLSKEKAQLLLVEAAYQLMQKGIEFELVLAGDGEMRSEIEDLIAQYGLTKQIRITGWLSSNQVREEILAARSLVLPSFTEGLPVVIMEAFALRRPVLATYVGGIPELVIQGENGWLFPAGSVNELAAALEDCLSKSPDELKKMGDSGFHRVVERHSIDTEAAKLAELFRASSQQYS
ncbi:glycosyltransferase family 4 protein [Sideroxydans sp. CL21]|uniref:glycosyltransferase family 4 protein n=1 Tax=Sideroxydans sp. CL21 TaxID=2600596 RepID=UPI0012A96730|nr:glycosyltransferase family 4 protein [Sideroxydans sp. CL21]VVC83688.1 Glycosyl transferase, group 1 family protein [Sideroxydans sp. CL21]